MVTFFGYTSRFAKALVVRWLSLNELRKIPIYAKRIAGVRIEIQGPRILSVTESAARQKRFLVSREGKPGSR